METEDFLATLPRLTRLSPGSDRGPLTELAAGESIGPYRLLSELGAGGMGAVWLAERSDGQLKRKVALKLPRLVWAKGLAERMARERDILATLEHPNIARLYDAGVDQHGRPYLALEYVEGQPIDVYAKERGLSVRQKLDLLLQVCSAVAFAHSRLVVHRDLKPSNILVTSDGQVRLLDFGIAKLMEGDSAKETQLTQLAGRALTLDYASPEQIKGEPIGTASDVYSLGVVAYELLTGAKPYKLKRGSAGEMEDAIASIDAPAASTNSSDAATSAQLRGDLDAVLNKALKKLPAERYGTVDGLAADLRGYLAGDAVSARPDSTAYRVRSWVDRHRLETAIAVAVALALLAGAYAQVAVALALGVGMAVALWQRNQALRSARRAEEQAAEAREQTRAAERAARREDQVKILYVEVLATLATWNAEQFNAPLAVARLVQQKLREVEEHPSTPKENVFAAQEAVMVQLPFMGDFEGALAVGQRYLAGLRAGGAPRAKQQIAYLGNARAMMSLGRLEDSIEHLREALRIEPDSDDALRNLARLRTQLSRGFLGMGRRQEALEALAPALEQVRRNPALYDRRHEVLQSQGQLLQGVDDLQALRFLEEAYAAYQSAMAPQQAETGVGLLRLGQSRLAVGQWAAAERDLRDAVAALDGIYGMADRDSVLAMTWLAAAVAAQGRFFEARALLEERRAVVQAGHGPDRDVALASLAARQIDLEVEHGDLDAASRASELIDAFDLRAAGLRNVDLVHPARARWLLLAGHADQARVLLQSRLDELQRLPDWMPETVRVRLLIAEIDVLEDRRTNAMQSVGELLARLQADGAIHTATHADAVALRAELLAAGGAASEAVELLAADEAARHTAGLGTPSVVQRAERALRAAGVQRRAGALQAARALLLQARDDLASQHPASPRLARLAQAMRDDGMPEAVN
ncbi:MAG: protein kinase [Burkholderiales bacterium]|nr:protein kinase [Burkholderiales bacterium]